MALLDQIPMSLLKIVLSKGNEPTALKELIVIFEKLEIKLIFSRGGYLSGT